MKAAPSGGAQPTTIDRLPIPIMGIVEGTYAAARIVTSATASELFSVGVE